MLHDELDYVRHATQFAFVVAANTASFRIVNLNEHPASIDRFGTDYTVAYEHNVISILSGRFAFCESGT